MRNEDPINYVQFFLDAYRSIVRRTLDVVVEQGMPPGHDIYLTFRTSAPGVEIPDDLHAKYPQAMTVVLEHEFWDLEVDDEGLSVVLMFSRLPKTLVIPFSSLIFYEDRQAGIRLGFLSPEELQEAEALGEAEVETLSSGDAVSLDEDFEDEEPQMAEVVSLDAFKRR